MDAWLQKIDKNGSKLGPDKIAFLYRLYPGRDITADMDAMFEEIASMSVVSLKRKAKDLPVYAPGLVGPMTEVVGDSMNSRLLMRRPGCAMEIALAAMSEGITPSEITRQASQMKTIADFDRFMSARRPKDMLSVQMAISDSPEKYADIGKTNRGRESVCPER